MQASTQEMTRARQRAAPHPRPHGLGPAAKQETQPRLLRRIFRGADAAEATTFQRCLAIHIYFATRR